jgi:hypothetical protein
MLHVFWWFSRSGLGRLLRVIIWFSVWTDQDGRNHSFAAVAIHIALLKRWSESVLFSYCSKLYVMNLCFIVIKCLLFWDSTSSCWRLKLGHPIPSGEHCEQDSGTRDACSYCHQIEGREKQGVADKSALADVNNVHPLCEPAVLGLFPWGKEAVPWSWQLSCI